MSPPPPLGPPHLYSIGTSPPVYLKKPTQSPRLADHSPKRHIEHHAASPQDSAAGGSARSASPSSPQLQPRAFSESQPSAYTLLSPATPSGGAPAGSLQRSPPRHEAAGTPRQHVGNVLLPLSPSSNPTWLGNSKSLTRGNRTPQPALNQPPLPTEVARGSVDDATVHQVRQYLQFSPMSVQMPHLHTGGPSGQQATLPDDGMTSPRMFDSTRRGASNRLEDIPLPRSGTSPQLRDNSDGPAARLDKLVAIHVRDAEQHHREAIAESFIAASQEMRLDAMMQRNILAQAVHKKSARAQNVMDSLMSEDADHRSSSATSPTPAIAATVWMPRPQIGFPEASQPRATSVYSTVGQLPMTRTAAESLQALRGRLPYTVDDITTPQRPAGGGGDSPFLSNNGLSDGRSAYRFHSGHRMALAQHATPRTAASQNAMEVLNRVLQEEERSRRTLIEASSTNASVILRQVFHCWLRGLHPTTLYVQEQHSFNTLMSAFEEESIAVHEQYQRWLWEQRAERIQYWTKRVATQRMDEDRDRDSLIVLQREQWTEMMRKHDIVRQQLIRDAMDERLRVEMRLRRSVATLASLEATIRDTMIVDQETARATIADAEDEAFHASLHAATKTGAVAAEECTARANVEVEERHQRREIEQMRKWSAPMTKAVAVASPLTAAKEVMASSVEGSPQSDRPLAAEAPPSMVSLEDSGYFLTHGEDHHPDHPNLSRTPRRRRSPAANRRQASLPPTERYMRHTASSSLRQSSPGTTERSPSQDNIFGGSFGGSFSAHHPPSEFAAHAPAHYETASSIRHPTSSLASDTEGGAVAPPPRLQPPQRAISPLQIQRTIDRLSKPKRRAEHIVDPSDELPSYTLSNHASSLAQSVFVEDERSTAQPRRAKVSVESPARQRVASVVASSSRSSSTRRSSFGRDEPMSMPSVRNVAQGNSVMILRGGPAPQSSKAPAGVRATTPGNGRAATTVRSSRRYVDAFYTPATPDSEIRVRDASINVSQSPIAVSHASVLSTESMASRGSQRPPTGRAPTSSAAAGKLTDAGRIEKLSKWETATLLMYEQSRRSHT